MEYTIEEGVDVSWWQGIINFIKMKLAGALFVIIRAGSCNKDTGKCYWDYNVATNAMGAIAAFLRLGFYWFYREFGIEHAKKQARFFWDTIREWPIDEGLFCDVEVWDAREESVHAFMVELKRVSGLPDNKLGIYSRASLWNYVVGAVNWALQFLCWVARYHSGIDHPWEDSERFHMFPWDEPDYWQKEADGNNRGDEFGVDSDDIDINWKFVYGDPEPEPEPDRARVEIIHSGPVDMVVREAA